jgi:hypothetical protein
MRCMREGLPAMAQARQNHVLILPGGIADVTARARVPAERRCQIITASFMPEEPAALARCTLLNAPRRLKVRPMLLSSSHYEDTLHATGVRSVMQ